jgi:hypothetical protein
MNWIIMALTNSTTSISTCSIIYINTQFSLIQYFLNFSFDITSFDRRRSALDVLHKSSKTRRNVICENSQILQDTYYNIIIAFVVANAE